MTSRYARAGLAGTLVLVMATGGCSVGDFLGTEDAKEESGAVPSPAAARCDKLLTAPTQNSKPASTTVLLADGSASVFNRPADGRSTAVRTDWAGKLAEHLPANGNDIVAVGVFGGSVTWQPQKITAGRSSDAQRTREDFEDIRGCLIGNLDKSLQTAPAKPHSDVLRALAEARDQVRLRAGAKTIYLATDALSNTGCADLRAAPIGDLTAIPAMVKSCAPEIPQLGKEYTVGLVGVGNPGEGWSDIGTPQRTWLVKFWKTMCEATGAKCLEPDPAEPGTTPTSGITMPAEHDVSMPVIREAVGNPAVLTVPSSLLFDIDSYTLAPDRAQDALQQVHDYLGRIKYRSVVIAGHTDSSGTPDHNRTLSRRRAAAVADMLRQKGVQNITTEGYASTRPACAPELVNGRLDPVRMACNRRVEILVYT